MTAVHIPYMYYTKFHCTYKLDPSCLLLPGFFYIFFIIHRIRNCKVIIGILI